MRRFALFLICAALPFGLSAGRLTLRDGTVIFGEFISGTGQNVVFQDDNGVRRSFDFNQIDTIDFNNVNTDARQDLQDLQRRGGLNQNQKYRDENSADRMDNRRPQGEWVSVPAGASISVRTAENINSQTAVEGRTYPATIEQDVMDSTGNVVVPRGSEAALVIRQVNEGGTLSNGNFVLDLDSIRVNGRRYVVNTVDMNAKDPNGIGKNKRTAEMVGGGAVLGTLLGAIAGGGKGAAIGAIAGAAAGGGVQVLTKGHEIRVPAETVLNFRLEQPLALREVR
jgi:uncharacterized protein YcfJ